ncbi:MAG: hypothetical protein AAB794_00665 [Patescibacteria group bacterium]
MRQVALKRIVDNLTKPPEGIEPSKIELTRSLSHPADGVFSIYHDITANVFTSISSVWTLGAYSCAGANGGSGIVIIRYKI